VNPLSAITEILCLNPKNSGHPIVSVIIPVLYESGIINSALQSLRNLSTRDLFEIIVVDGNPQASTIRHIKDRSIKCIVGPAGRGAQMNKGAKHASGGILLFLHADTRLPPNGIDEIITVLRKPEVAAGAFDLGIDSPELFFRFIERVASARSRMTKIPYGDQAIFIKKSIFIKIGGYREIPIMEDIELMRRIKKSGGQIHIIRDQAKTSSRRWDKEGIICCTARNVFLSTLFYCGVSPFRLSRFYQWETPNIRDEG
jgi:rSAM/selenodomain-associated transferase 2